MRIRRMIAVAIAAALIVLSAGTLFASGAAQATAATDQPIQIELLQSGWLNVPNDPATDPYQKWIDETFDVEFTLTSTAEFNNLVLVRFAGGDHPDILNFGGNKTMMETVYSQAVLLQDWNPHMSRIPTIDERYPDAARTLFTVDGNLITIAREPELPIWSFKIRQDWLDEQGLSVPTTDRELLDVAREFTRNDPNRTGRNDTYAFTSAGGGQSLGEIENLLTMYGPMSFHITSSGEVSHPIINGDQKRFYDFMRTLVDERLIDPDWYTQGWNERKPALFSGAFGIAWYPGVLVNEIEGGTGNTGMSLDWWTSMATPAGSPTGGKRNATGVHGILLSVSRTAEQDQPKFAKILEIMDATTFPSDGFWKLRWGVGIDNFEVFEMEGGYRFIDVLGSLGQHYRGGHGNMGGWDWGTWLSPGRHDRVVEGTVPEPGPAAIAQVSLDVAAIEFPTYEPQAQLLNLDPTLVQNALDAKREFEIKYILGETSDYDGFMRQWLSLGGQELLESATRQFRDMGMLR